MTFYIGVDFHPHQQTLSWRNDRGQTIAVRLAIVQFVEVSRAYYKRRHLGVELAKLSDVRHGGGRYDAGKLRMAKEDRFSPAAEM